MSKKTEEQQKYIDIIGEIENSYALMKKVRPLSMSTFDETKLLRSKKELSRVRIL